MNIKAANPFNPSFGRVPPVYIGMDEKIENLSEELENPNSPYQTTMIYAQRGCGKTAFMVAASKEIEKKNDWVVIDLPPYGDMLLALIQNLYAKTSSAIQKILSKIEGVTVSVAGTGIVAGLGAKSANYTITLEKMFDRLQKKGIKVLITIDEVEKSPELRAFTTTYKHLMQRGYHISLLMAGLPQNINAFINAKGLTFLLRAQRIELPFLSEPMVRGVYKRTFFEKDIAIENSALAIMSKSVDGYAYAFQLMGYYVWAAAKENSTVTNMVVEGVLDDYKTALFSNAYTAICAGLSEMDKSFLAAAAKLSDNKGEVLMEDIVSDLQKEPSYVSTYRKRLLAIGVIHAVSYGRIRFTLPYFSEYVKEYLAYAE